MFKYTPNLAQNIPRILFKIYPKCVFQLYTICHKLFIRTTLKEVFVGLYLFDHPISRTHSRPQIWCIFWIPDPKFGAFFGFQTPNLGYVLGFHTPKFGVWFGWSKRYRPTKTSFKVVRINNLWHIVYDWNTHLRYILNQIRGIFWTRFGVYFEQDLGYIITIIGVYYNKNWDIYAPKFGVYYNKNCGMFNETR